ncbi:hypothetical protein MUP77_18770 [Candidatus Bathyarchaeota archaeon]|nr:hypothetical protein [Candidatus Bathyarchaeota archaeon]
MSHWNTIIDDPTVLFGGAKKRIEAIRITAYLAENIESPTRQNLINVASARLGISRRKVEEEYIPDLETRGILVFEGNSYTVNREPASFQLLDDPNPRKKLESNPKAKNYLQAKANLVSRESKIKDVRKILEKEGSCGVCGNKEKTASECFSDDCKGLKALLGSGFEKVENIDAK